MVVATRPRTVNERRGRQLAGSATWYERAKEVFPSGVTHETRFFQPFPIYIARADGSRKWDVDGNEYVDYIGGHGALLLGHGHPAVTAAATEQLRRGTQYGASHELEVRWAELVTEIVPSAEQVRFHSSGTEATMMAMRLARAFTGKDVIVKMHGHFHGWHDYAALQMAPPYDEPVSVGIPQAVQESVVGVPAGDIAALRAVLDARDDVAGVILLCNGLSTEYLQQVRDLTRERGVILIFDEVVTGFRWAPGGCQEYHGVVPDLTTLAKILAGGSARRRGLRTAGHHGAIRAPARRPALEPLRSHCPPRHVQRQSAGGRGGHRLSGDRPRPGHPAAGRRHGRADTGRCQRRAPAVQRWRRGRRER